MKDIKFLDKTTRVLVFASIVGTILGLYLINYYNSISNSSVSDGTVIAKITSFKNDVRIKRSGTSYWIPVNSQLECYTNDLIFTGDSSSATLLFNQGDSVEIDTNSLIGVSQQSLFVESGSVDVNVKSSNSLKVESFGRVLSLDRPGLLKIVNNDSQKTYTSDNGNISVVNSQETTVRREHSIEIIKPYKLQIFPLLVNTEIEFNWLDRLKNNDLPLNYRLDFSTDADFKNIFHSVKTSNQFININISYFKPGMVFFKVTPEHHSDNGNVYISQFVINKEIEIKITEPANRSSFELIKGEAKVHFNWLQLFEGEVKLQISKDDAFTNIFHEQIFSLQTSFQYVFNKTGKYYFRLGYLQSQQITWASRVNSFTILSPVKKEKISFFNFSESYNFREVESYRLYLNDPNNALYYIVYIYSADKVIHEHKLSKREFNLDKMEPGAYKIKFKAFFDDGTDISSDILHFEVIDNAPPKAPEVKPYIQDIFVKLLNLIFPSAYASESVELKWSGDEKTDAFQIEIYKGDQLHSVEMIKEPFYMFNIEIPGNYSWRVRALRDGAWSSFSRINHIYAKDKIIKIDRPLMQNVFWDKQSNDLIFFWDEPYNDLKYFIQIFHVSDEQPFLEREVSGGKFKLQIDSNINEIKWRIFAKSSHGNISNDVSLRRFLLRRKSFNAINFQLSQVESKQKQTINTDSIALLNKDNSFSGKSFLFSYKNNISIQDSDYLQEFSLNVLDLKRSGDEYQQNDYSYELGAPLFRNKLITHKFFFGGQISDLKIADSLGNIYQYKFNMFSFRYDFIKDLSFKNYFNFSAKSLMLLHLDYPRVSFQLKSAYFTKISSLFHIGLFLGLQRNSFYSPNLSGSVSGRLDLSNNLLHYGVDLVGEF